MKLSHLAVASVLSVLILNGCDRNPQEVPDPPLPETEPPAGQLEAPDAPAQPATDADLAPAAEAAPSAAPLPMFAAAEDYEAFCGDTLALARIQFEGLEAFEGEPTVESFYEPMNQLILTFLRGISLSSLYGNVYPDEAIRTAAEKCEQDFTSLGTEISLSRPLFDAVSAIDPSSADAATEYSLMKSVRDFKRSGVDKDDETREEIRALIDEITEIGQAFDRNIRDDVRFIELPPEKLNGLPADYIDSHAPGENGLVKITTDYPDYIPFMTYAEDDEARLALRTVSRSIGHPQNDPVLKSLLVKRAELAALLGYPTYAHYHMADKMIGTPERAESFLDEIAGTVKEAAGRDKAILLERLKEIDPDATEVGVWQYNYLKEVLSKEKYNVDSKTLRTYFQADKVKQGIFDLTSDLFGIEIREWDVPVWNQTVTAHELWQDGKKIGLFYLDLYPREGKYKHAAHWGVVEGIEGVQLPVSVLVTNFPGKDDPSALMEFDDVSTFLHEFGHLLHHQFAGHVKWANNSGTGGPEWDFVEAPSQMLEEWIYDYDTLKTFAVNSDGETIPEDLVEQLNKARFFGMGIDTAIQTFYASLSLQYHLQDPEAFELLPLMKELQAKYSAFPYVENTYFYDNFGHLNGYAAGYYTYQWSLAIATDMFSRFKEAGLRDAEISLAYREAVLDPGGSKPADELVKEFLGRPFTTEAYKAWLTRTE